MEIRPSQTGDHSGESSQSSEKKRIVPLDVVRQQRTPSLLDLTLKNFKLLKPEHFQNEAGWLFLQTELAGRVFKAEEGNDWLQRHDMEFFNTEVGEEWFDSDQGKEWFSEHGLELLNTERAFPN